MFHVNLSIGKRYLQRGVRTIGSVTDFFLRRQRFKLQRLLTSLAFVGTCLSEQVKAIVFPDMEECFHKLVEHFPSVVGRGGDAESLLASLHGRVVDSLDIYAVFVEQIIGQPSTQGSITNLQCANKIKFKQCLFILKLFMSSQLSVPPCLVNRILGD